MPEEIQMENEPLPRNMESSDVTKEQKEKPRKTHSNKEPLSESLDQSPDQPELESQILAYFYICKYTLLCTTENNNNICHTFIQIQMQLFFL